jgi:RNA:NAD 2'-phosphotransferase (TPT1/KptA family)
MGRINIVAVRLDDETYGYIVDLAAALDLKVAWVARKFLEYAVREHKEGRLELLATKETKHE